MYSNYPRKKFEKKLSGMSKEEILKHIKDGLWFKWKVELATKKLELDAKNPAK